MRGAPTVPVEVKRLPWSGAYLWCAAQVFRLLLLPAGLFFWHRVGRNGWRPLWLWRRIDFNLSADAPILGDGPPPRPMRPPPPPPAPPPRRGAA